jgi:cytochrome c553
MRAWLRAKSWAVSAVAGGILTLCAAGAAIAEGDPAAGQAKAMVCFGCHGEDGNSPVADFPRLAGQYGAYIVKQVRDFQTGLRDNNPIMTGMAATVASVEDAKDIGAFFQSQKLSPNPITPAPSRDVLQRGERLYRQGNPANGVYGCINCHGENGMGRSPTISQFPVLGAQHRDYLIKQLNDFASGQRKNDPAGMMGDIARKLSDDEIQAVAEYLANITPPSR